MKSISKSEVIFIEKLKQSFPTITLNVEEDNGYLVLQVGAFKRFTQNAINSGDKELVLKCFKFVEENMNKFEHNVENSLVLSWLDKLDFTIGDTIYNLLSPKLKQIHLELKQYNPGISTNKKVSEFLKNVNH